MFERILVASDGSPLSSKAVEKAAKLALAIEAPLVIVTVTEPFPVYTGALGFDYALSEDTLADYAKGQKSLAAGILAEAAEAAKRVGIMAETLHLPDGDIAEAILQAAASRDCDLIVMGSHGRRGLGRIMLGSKTAEVLAHSQIPVLVIRE